MEDSMFITILSSLLDGLVSVVLAGVVIWIWQDRYSEKRSHDNILFERKCKEEDLFYENFREVKYGLYKFFLIISGTSTANNAQEAVYTIVSNMQLCMEKLAVSEIALKKYIPSAMAVFDKYNEFAELYKQYNLSKNGSQEVSDKLDALKEEIFSEIRKVDRLYFYEKL